MTVLLRKLWALEMLAWGTSIADIRVLSAIFEYHDDQGGGAWPSIDTLSKVCKLGRRTVQVSLGRLQKAGLIAIERGNGRRRGNLYRLNLNALPTSSPVSKYRQQVAQEKRVQRAALLNSDKGAADCTVLPEKGCNGARQEGAADRTLSRSIYLKDLSAVDSTLSEATSIEPDRTRGSAGEAHRAVALRYASQHDPWHEQLIGIERRIDAGKGNYDAAALDQWHRNVLATARGPGRSEVARRRAKDLLSRIEALKNC